MKTKGVLRGCGCHTNSTMARDLLGTCLTCRFPDLAPEPLSGDLGVRLRNLHILTTLPLSLTPQAGHSRVSLSKIGQRQNPSPAIYSPCDPGFDLFETQFLICKMELITIDSSQGFSEEGEYWKTRLSQETKLEGPQSGPRKRKILPQTMGSHSTMKSPS